MSSTSSVIASLAVDQDADIDGVKSVLQALSPGAVYEASYWSSALSVRLVFNSLAGNSQLLLYATGPTGLLTDTYSFWQPGDPVPNTQADSLASASASWSTYTLVQSQGTPVSGSQLSLASSPSDGAVYVPVVGNSLAINHPHLGSVTLSGDLVQDHVITALSSLTDTDNLGDFSYVWQKASTANASEGNWITIDGATAAQFSPTADEANNFLRAKLTYTDGLGYVETAISAVSNTAIVANQAPAAVDSSVYSARGEAYTFKASDFGFSDPDSGDLLSGVSLLNLPVTGTLTFQNHSISIPTEGFFITTAQLGNGDLVFTPDANATDALQEDLGFLVYDSLNTPSSNTGHLSLMDSSRPTSSDVQMDGTVATPLDIRPYDFTFDDSDPGDVFESITVTQLPLHGQLTLGGQAVTVNQSISWESMYDLGLSFTPSILGSANYLDHMKFTVSDGKVNSSQSYDLQFTVANPDNLTNGLDLTGQVLHWKGLTPAPIPGVSLTIGSNTPITTDATGSFDLTGASFSNGDAIAPVVGTAFTKASDAGITLNDVLATLKVYLGRDLPSDYKSPFNLIAADFDGNGVVNLSDVLGLLKYYLGRTPAPSADKTWAFVNASDVSSDGLHITGLNGDISKTDVHLKDLTVDTSTTSVTLIGVIRGDVDGSWASLPHTTI